MASEKTYNFTIERAAEWSRKLTWLNEQGNPVNNATYVSSKLEIRRGADAEIIKTLTVGSGITLGGSNGEIDLYINGTDTALFPDDELVYDLLMRTTAQGSGIRLIEGTITVSKEVTKRI